ncbi:MAG: uroporphyrinogen-III C-methyltransferase [Sphingobacteriia bacterium]
MKNPLPPSAGHVTLVGAGPGDPELITLKGLRALQQADIVFYYALVNPALLEHLPPAAVRVYVGKRAANHSCPQPQIQAQLVAAAQQYRQVVRLKGGDPYILGRAQEEVDYVRAAGISVSVVPGISSALAGPVAAGLPLTQRGRSEGVHVVSAVTQHGTLSDALRHGVHLPDTTVVLMVQQVLPQVLQLYIDAGKGHWPATLVQDATLPAQRQLSATVEALAPLAQAWLHREAPTLLAILPPEKEPAHTQPEPKTGLYPIFLKAARLQAVIVGGGAVALEKLTHLLRAVPQAQVRLIAPHLLPELETLAQGHRGVEIVQRAWLPSDLEGANWALIATENADLNLRIFEEAQARNILANVADTPNSCDFYLGSIVTKGQLRIGISTNGYSPTLAKRLREVLETELPEAELDELLHQLKHLRMYLKGDFAQKVRYLNELTAELIPPKQ